MKKRPLIPSPPRKRVLVPGNKFLPAEDQIIREGLKRGDSRATIAVNVGRSTNCVNGRISRLGLSKSRLFTAKDDATIKALAAAGQSCSQIARAMGRRDCSIFCRARRLGVTLPRKRSKLCYTPEQDATMRQMWADGFSAEAIGQQIGKTPSQVMCRVWKHRIKRKPKPLRIKTKQAIAAQMKAPSVQKKKDPWTWPWERRVA